MHGASHTQIRILVVEDDPAQQAILVSWLTREGYQVEAFNNGLQARNYLADHWADLMILDWDVPGMPGDKLLGWIRGRSRSTVPVIFQTIHSSEIDIVKILDSGADDFLVKPLEKMVLLARIRALLRRYTSLNHDGRRLPIGSYMLDRNNLSLSSEEMTHVLGMKEFDILWHLATQPGMVVQRQDLQSLVWGLDAAVQSRSVDMYVSRLRSSLKSAGLAWTIQSVYATGYRLNLVESTAPRVSAPIPRKAPIPEMAVQPSLESVWVFEKKPAA